MSDKNQGQIGHAGFDVRPRSGYPNPILIRVTCVLGRNMYAVSDTDTTYMII